MLSKLCPSYPGAHNKPRLREHQSSGKWGFDSELTDNNFEHLLDSDYNEPNTDNTYLSMCNSLNSCKFSLTFGNMLPIYSNQESIKGPSRVIRTLKGPKSRFET